MILTCGWKILRVSDRWPWVREQNAATVRELGTSAEFEALRQRLLAIFDSKERIPGVVKHGAYYYNFWQDGTHVRGLWRRTTLEEYKKADPSWETVLDLDKLSEAEGENWVWKGSDVLRPTYDRALIFLPAAEAMPSWSGSLTWRQKNLFPADSSYRKPRRRDLAKSRHPLRREPTSVRGHSRGRDTRASSRNGIALLIK